MENYTPKDYMFGKWWIKWKERADQHDYEVHQLQLPRGEEDPSCPICHHATQETFGENTELKENFENFWEWYGQNYDAMTYTTRTIQNLGNAIIQESIIHE